MELPTGIFIITNVSHKLNLVLGKVSDKRGPVVARVDPSTEFAKWKITHRSNGEFHIQNHGSPKHAAATHQGGPPVVGQCVETVVTRVQQWSIRETEFTSGTYIISVQGGEYCWGLPYNAREESYVTLAEFPNQEHNHWILHKEPLSDDTVAGTHRDDFAYMFTESSSPQAPSPSDRELAKSHATSNSPPHPQSTKDSAPPYSGSDLNGDGSDDKKYNQSEQARSLIGFGSKAPTKIKTPDPPLLWALVIGINNYSTVTKLSGAVPDADAISDYLQTDLKVPPHQIVNLRDKEATRSKIIASFQGLRDNPRIKHQDPILIYYAGKGGEVPSHNKDKTRALIPVDYVANRIVPPIPDRTVAALINGISKKHGNNITVIFDCCYSISGSRDDEEDESSVRGCELSPDDVPDDLDAHICKTNPEAHKFRGLAAKVINLNSYIFLTACSPIGLAWEDRNAQGARGRFTTALLELLRTVPPDQITYADVLTKIPRIDGQTPQCEGFYKNRILFDSKVRPPTHGAYEVQFVNKKYRLGGGRAHGVTDGAEFTLYRSREAALVEAPLGVMIAKEDKIKPFTTTLEPVNTGPRPFENPAVAIQTKAGASEDLLLYVPLESRYMPVFEAITREMSGTGAGYCRIKLASKAEKDGAKLEVAAVGKNQFAFDVLEKRARERGFTRMPHVVDEHVDDLHRILCAASHYHFHLNHNHPDIRNSEINDSIKIEFFPLEEEYDDNAEVVLYPGGENLQRRGRIEVEVDEGIETKYGMKISNSTAWDLHFFCFFFDHADFSITAFTELDSETQHQFCFLEKGSTVEIGYGNSSIQPLESIVPEGLDVTIGFFKLYFTSEVVDLSHIPQMSPFSSSPRNMKAPMKRNDPVWGTVLIPVTQKRKEGHRA